MFRKKTSKFALLMALGLAILNFGCASVRSSFQKAQKVDTIAAYEQFITENADSELVVEAKAKIETIEWENALHLNTVEAYRAFLSSYPSSARKAKANELIEDIVWTDATSADNAAAIMAYLEQYQTGRYKSLAMQKLDHLKFRGACNQDSRNAYQDYLRTFPRGEHALAARERIETLAYDRLGTASRADSVAFLAEFPSGAHASDIRKVLLSTMKISEFVVRVQGQMPPEVTAERIKQYSEAQFARSLREIGLICTCPGAFRIASEFLVRPGDWWMSMGGQRTVVGVQITSVFRVETESGNLILEHSENGADYWLGGDQWSATTGSIDLHVGRLLVKLAQLGIKPEVIAKYLVNSKLLPTSATTQIWHAGSIPSSREERYQPANLWASLAELDKRVRSSIYEAILKVIRSVVLRERLHQMRFALLPNRRVVARTYRHSWRIHHTVYAKQQQKQLPHLGMNAISVTSEGFWTMRTFDGRLSLRSAL